MTFLVITALLTFCIVNSANTSLRDEHRCYSQFDYEYKVVQKLIMLENAYNEQLEINKALRTEIKSARNRGAIVAFSACLSHKLSNIQSEQIIIFNSVILNEADGYDENTGIFLCPQDGIYHLTFFIGIRGDQQFFVRLMVNNYPRREAAAEGRHHIQDIQGGNSIMIKLHKGDKVWVQQYFGTELSATAGSRLASFSGVLRLEVIFRTRNYFIIK